MARSRLVAVGLDFGTESVRALVVDMRGNELGSAAVKYPHGQIIDRLPGTHAKLPPDFALQHPIDWLDASAKATRQAMQQGGVDPQRVVGIGVDFTSCTMLPCKGDGTPLSQTAALKSEIFAWPKLWKHHGAKSQADRINALARQRGEAFLDSYGGIIGLEWFFPKLLETLEEAPHVYDAADVWIEAGDWYVWQLIGTDRPIPRSTCLAGYKAMWSASAGYPSPDFLAAVDPRLGHVVAQKMPGHMLSPGQKAGELCDAMAKRLGLMPGIPVSACIIDAHAGVPGAGVAEPSTLVMVLGTSSCHMLNSRIGRTIPGVAGIVEGGILPGYFGYETGQSAVGDAFEWLRRTTHRSFDELNAAAAAVAPGADGVLCIDWLNGCRTPYMDGSLTGAFTGLTLRHDAAHLYRALLEASAFGIRWTVEILEQGGVPVRRFVATGGLPHHNPLLVQIYADVLGERITIHPSKQGPALGAAILGVLAAGKQATGFASASQAIHALAGSRDGGRLVRPDRAAHKAYEPVYRRYRALAEQLAAEHPHA